MLSSNEYLAAARVARESGGVNMSAAAQAWELKAKEAQRREDALVELGFTILGVAVPGGGPLYVGVQARNALIEKGWTPPEGLFE